MFECGLCNYSDVRMTTSTGASTSTSDWTWCYLWNKIINQNLKSDEYLYPRILKSRYASEWCAVEHSCHQHWTQWPSVDPELSSVDSKSPQIDPDTAASVPVSSVRSITVAGSFYTLTVGEWTQPVSVFSLLQGWLASAGESIRAGNEHSWRLKFHSHRKGPITSSASSFSKQFIIWIDPKSTLLRKGPC